MTIMIWQYYYWYDIDILFKLNYNVKDYSEVVLCIIIDISSI